MTAGTISVIAPVEKMIRVRATPERAFEAFTKELGVWWPIETNSLDTENAEAIVLEPKIGGRLYQRQKDGSIIEWATVEVMDAPERLVLSWFVGRAPTQSSTVEITFQDVGGGLTEVRLVHSGFENMEVDDPQDHRDRYDNGWVNVFDRRFADALGGRVAA